MKYLLILLLLVLDTVAKEPIRIAPLPMINSEKLIREYQPFLGYLEKELNHPFELVYFADYSILLEKIRKGEVDVAFLGPLPYIELKKQDKGVRPIVRFLDSKGKDHYTCTLFTTKNHNIQNIKDIKNPKISLTQRFSTCGYFATELMLNSEDISLKNLDYSYTGSHTNVILYVSMGDYDIGSVKSSILNNYKNLGIVKLKESPYFSGFVLVASSKLKDEYFEKIKETLIKLKPIENQKDKEITKNWRKSMSYGAVEAYDFDYDEMRKMLDAINMKDIKDE